MTLSSCCRRTDFRGLRLVAICLAVATCVDMRATANGSESPATYEDLAIVEEAFISHEATLKSQRAKGSFRYYRAGTNGGQECASEAVVEVAFHGDKYFVKLVYDHDWLGRTARIIVYDGSVIATSRFSENISMTGAEADIYEAKPDGTGSVRPQRAEFPWDIAHLARRLACVPALIRNIGREKLRCSRLNGGAIEIVYPLGASSRGVVVCGAGDGYHVVDRRVEKTDGSIYQHIEGHWIEIDGVWAVKTLRETFTGRERWELEFDSLELNGQIDPKLFTLDALELPGGARVVDRMAEEKRGAADIHYTEVDDSQVKASVDAMMDRVKSLPTQRRPSDGTPRNIFKVVLLINVILISIVLALLGWHRVKHRKLHDRNS